MTESEPLNLLKLDLPTVPVMTNFVYDPKKALTIGYMDKSGRTSIRQIVPEMVIWGNSEGWLLDAYDTEKKAWFCYAMKDILFWKPAP